VVKYVGQTSTASDNHYPIWKFRKDLGRYTRTEFENLRIYFDIRDEDVVDGHDLFGMGSFSMEFTPGKKRYPPHEKGYKGHS